MLDEQLEINRLQSAQEVMYGNKDSQRIFPIDVETRLSHYTIFVEKRVYDEDTESFKSLKRTRKYQQIDIHTWENLLGEGNYYEKRKYAVTILHDPKLQADLEGKAVADGKIKSNAQLRSLVGKAKSAEDFAVQDTKSTQRGKKGGDE